MKRQSGKRAASPALNHPFYIASIEKAFRLLAAFDQKSPEMSLSQLSEATSLTIPNVQRITHTLVELGLLTKDVKIASDLAGELGVMAPLCAVTFTALANAREALGYSADFTAAHKHWTKDSAKDKA